jgi:sporulation protein YlmC with PRC-barrel domain
MRELFRIAVAAGIAAAVVGASGVTVAQPRPFGDAARPAFTMPADTLLSARLIGARIKNADGKDLGEIDHLIINAKTGQISHAVIGVGGLAGIGESKRVVQWSDLRIQPDPVNPWRSVASIDQSVVDRAPLWPARAEGRDPVPAASPPTTPASPGTR